MVRGPALHYTGRNTPAVGRDDLVPSDEQEAAAGGPAEYAAAIAALPVPATVRVQVPSGKRVTAVAHLPERKPLKFDLVGP